MNAPCSNNFQTKSHRSEGHSIGIREARDDLAFTDQLDSKLVRLPGSDHAARFGLLLAPVNDMGIGDKALSLTVP